MIVLEAPVGLIFDFYVCLLLFCFVTGSSPVCGGPVWP